MPIPINALGATVTDNHDGTYTAVAPLPVPVTAGGTGTVAMEGRAAGQDAATGAWTVRVPVKSAYRCFRITDSSIVARRQIVDLRKFQACHRSDGLGAAPRLVLHGSNRTEELNVCVTCHDPNNSDSVFRRTGDPTAQVGPHSYPEQSLDFKALVHGIHAGAAGFRENPLGAIGFNHSLFDASTLAPYPGGLENCAVCHIDNGRRGTFELPLQAGVIGSSMDTASVFGAAAVASLATPPLAREGRPVARVSHTRQLLLLIRW